MQMQWLAAIAAMFMACLTCRSALAARGMPPPVMESLAGEYGIVVAEVVRANPENAGSRHYDVTFRVREIIVQPIGAPALPANRNDLVRVNISTGYAASIEFDDDIKKLAPGSSLVLTIRHAQGDRYEHVIGASAVRTKPLTDQDRHLYAKLRELAAVPVADRPTVWPQVVGDSTASDALRSNVLAAIALGRLNDALTAEQRAKFWNNLLAVWNDARSTFSPDLLQALDSTLRVTDSISAFEKSEDRVHVWIARLLTPTAANRAENNDRDNLVHSVFRDLLINRPDLAGPPCVAMLSDMQWPATFRRAVGAALLMAYEMSAAPDSTWEPALQAHFTRVLLSKEAWPIRLVSADLVSASAGNKRPIKAGESLRAALQQALGDMEHAASQGVPEASTAVGELKTAIASVAKPAVP